MSDKERMVFRVSPDIRVSMSAMPSEKLSTKEGLIIRVFKKQDVSRGQTPLRDKLVCSLLLVGSLSAYAAIPAISLLENTSYAGLLSKNVIYASEVVQPKMSDIRKMPIYTFREDAEAQEPETEDTWLNQPLTTTSKSIQASALTRKSEAMDASIDELSEPTETKATEQPPVVLPKPATAEEQPSIIYETQTAAPQEPAGPTVEASAPAQAVAEAPQTPSIGLSTGAEDSVAKFAFNVPSAARSFKSFMDYNTITAKNSLQYKLQQTAITDENGFRRYPSGDGNCYYMIALGTYYTGYSCGKLFRITLDTGESFEAVTGDVKSDAHTDALHQHRNGNVVEFIVDYDALSQDCKVMGDMSYADPHFEGKIAKIEAL